MSEERREMAGHSRMMAGEKPVATKKTLRKLGAYMQKYRTRLVLIACCAVIGTGFSVAAPKVLGQATTTVFEGVQAVLGGTGSLNLAKLAGLLLVVLGLYLSSAAFSFLQGWVLSGVANSVGFDLRRQLAEKLDRLPVSALEQSSKGEIQSKIVNDVDVLQMGLTSSFLQIVTAVVSLVGIVVMMLSISGWLTLAALVLLPLSGWLIRVITKHSQIYFRGQLNHLGQVNGLVEETLSGQGVLRAFHQEEAVLGEFKAKNARLYAAGWKAQFYSGLSAPVTQLAGNLAYVVIAVFGGVLVIQRAIAVGDMQAFFQYSKNFTQPIGQLAQMMNMLQASVAAAERIFAFLEAPEEAPDMLLAVQSPVGVGEIVFDQVSFGYQSGQSIIHDFSAIIKPGQKVAIVGPTGAGKTTLVKLLMRFYDVDAGRIEIAGHDIRDYSRDGLRAMLGMVVQDVWLFPGTILENIRYGRLEATDEEVIEAAKAACAHTFIMQQEMGYQTMLDEEAGNLSQGQKQLLTIARAILADKRILILDEATSSVDTRTEGLLQKAMARMLEGRTSLVIAHRLSTIRDADSILVVKEGAVIEQGTHQALLAKDGFYAQLYRSQFEQAA